MRDHRQHDRRAAGDNGVPANGDEPRASRGHEEKMMREQGKPSVMGAATWVTFLKLLAFMLAALAVVGAFCVLATALTFAYGWWAGGAVMFAFLLACCALGAWGLRR